MSRISICLDVDAYSDRNSTPPRTVSSWLVQQYAWISRSNIFLTVVFQTSLAFPDQNRSLLVSFCRTEGLVTRLSARYLEENFYQVYSTQWHSQHCDCTVRNSRVLSTASDTTNQLHSTPRSWLELGFRLQDTLLSILLFRLRVGKSGQIRSDVTEQISIHRCMYRLRKIPFISQNLKKY